MSKRVPTYEETAETRAFERVKEPESRQAIVDAFHQLFYREETRTWLNTTWLGMRLSKCPLDLWIYQEILYELRPDVIVESGTFAGGSALYLASICDLMNHGRVYTVDVEKQPDLPVHPRVEYLRGSSTSEEVLSYLTSRIGEKETVLVILDSDHSRDHVFVELQVYSRLVTPGSYIILEDTNVNGHPVLPDYRPGPMEGLDDFLVAHGDEFQIDREREKFLLTFNPRGYLRFVGRSRGGSASDQGADARASATGARARSYPYRNQSDLTRDAASRTVRLVGPDKHVLDLECGTGILARHFVDQGCTVVGVEGNAGAAREAAEICERVIVTDLSEPGWEHQLGSDRFDVITANGLLEHLEDPAACLRGIRRLVRPGGYVVASVPNVAHGSLRLALLGGEFQYRELGLLDRTHLRFFTRRSVLDLFDDAGYVVQSIERIERPIDGTEIPIPKETPPELLDALSADEEARTYQFLIVASPIRHGSETALRERLRSLTAENDQLRHDLQALTRPEDLTGQDDSEVADDSIRRRLVQFRALVLDLRRQLVERQAVIERIQAELLSRTKAPNASETLLKERVEVVAALGDRLRREIEEAAVRSVSLSDELARKDVEFRALHARLVSAESNALSAEISIREARERQRDLEKELEKIHTSKLWRIGSLYWRARRLLGLRS